MRNDLDLRPLSEHATPANVGDGAEKIGRHGCGSGRRVEGHHDPHGVSPVARGGDAEIGR
jgi:hypothetical protein